MVDSDANSLVTWEASPSERWAADLLARCHTQTETAEIIGVEPRSIRRYWQNPEFRAMVHDIQDALAVGYDDEFAGLIADSLRVVRMAVRGEIAGSDARVALAQDTLARTAYRIAVEKAVNRASVPGLVAGN